MLQTLLRMLNQLINTAIWFKITIKSWKTVRNRIKVSIIVKTIYSGLSKVWNKFRWLGWHFPSANSVVKIHLNHSSHREILMIVMVFPWKFTIVSWNWISSKDHSWNSSTIATVQSLEPWINWKLHRRQSAISEDLWPLSLRPHFWRYHWIFFAICMSDEVDRVYLIINDGFQCKVKISLKISADSLDKFDSIIAEKRSAWSDLLISTNMS